MNEVRDGELATWGLPQSAAAASIARDTRVTVRGDGPTTHAEFSALIFNNSASEIP
jgi:hypothetical protein